MPPKKAAERAISDGTVKSATGKSLKQWYAILDKFGADKKGHTAGAAYLHNSHDLSGWWSQMVTVRYEQDRGLRAVGQRMNGRYEVSIQRTIAAAQKQAYAAFTDPKLLSKWFTTKARIDLRPGGRYSNSDGDQGEYRTVTPPRRVRFTWENEKHCPGSLVEATFTPSGKGKVAVRIQHTKLPDAKGRDDMRMGWSWTLDSLKSFLETGRPIQFEEWKKTWK
ncbi:MAG TPA: SRPBCC family protein [candidate division Zixibacteria bacterium]|jgi:uncharacterized protein YndB with AHSA1/START domain